MFFNSFKADRVEESSAQAKVLFGQEANLKQKVVCKQYSIYRLKAMMKEIRIFALLER